MLGAIAGDIIGARFEHAGIMIKEVVKSYIQNHFGYDLSSNLKIICENYGFEVSCQGERSRGDRARDQKMNLLRAEQCSLYKCQKPPCCSTRQDY